VILYLKGATLRAEFAAREQSHAVRQCAAELSRQVKRDRDKRRRRREARAAGPQPAV
jgi:ribosome-associated translation inhibitor RaiA